MAIMRTWTTGGCALAALALALAHGAASAAEPQPFLLAPSSSAPPAPELAAVYALKLRLSEGRGLARLLLDAGVNRDDAAAAARLAAGNVGAGPGGCTAKVEISRGVEGRGYKLERVTLLTDAGATVIERRRGKLAIASQTGAARPRLV
jgi:hypothetical protein